MSANVITCDFMDEAPGHNATEHEPHAAAPDLGTRISYEDGDLERFGYTCQVCQHIVTPELVFHTDPRLDVAS